MPPYDLSKRLVIGVASSAVFDLRESDAVFREKGEAEYRNYQEAHLLDPLGPGTAFSFVKRLLSLNDLSLDPSTDPLVEVILLSRNDPDTGLRVMESIKHHGLAITRAIFSQGRAPYHFIPALDIALFLSGSKSDVLAATRLGYPAGQVLDSIVIDESDDDALRIAFDFDGVLADDESEAIYKAKGMTAFHVHESANSTRQHSAGPLHSFLLRVSHIQSIEEGRRRLDPDYRNRLRVSIVTARNAPSHLRAVQTLKTWGVMVNDAFFLGGIDKGKVLAVLRPHIFFDDQMDHLLSASKVVASVHIPFGVANAPTPVPAAPPKAARRPRAVKKSNKKGKPSSNSRRT